MPIPLRVNTPLPVIKTASSYTSVTTSIARHKIELPALNKGVVHIRLGYDMPDALQIIMVLQKLAVQYGRLPLIREATVNLLSCIKDNNKLEAAVRVIMRFVMDRVIYLPDPAGSEYVISPVRMLEKIDQEGQVKGDCDDHVLLFNSMLQSIGIETQIVAVKLKNPVLFDHVISTVRLPDGWQDIDLCAKRMLQPFYQQRLIAAA